VPIPPFDGDEVTARAVGVLERATSSIERPREPRARYTLTCKLGGEIGHVKCRIPDVRYM
jgi:hypothetical protein